MEQATSAAPPLCRSTDRDRSAAILRRSSRPAADVGRDLLLPDEPPEELDGPRNHEGGTSQVKPRCLIPLSTGCEDHWSWNKNDKSHEVRLYGPKQRIAHFHPNWSNGTAGVRGTRILNGGRFYWEINVSQRIFGTSMMFGIGTKKARLHVDAFVNMLGEDDQSWGLSHKGLLWHSGHHRQYVKCFRENKATTIGMYFDGVAGTLSYYKDNTCLGVAFSGLGEVQEPLYPIVCSTAAKTEMSLGVLKRDFVNLQDRCRATVLKQLTHEEQIDQLCLPLRIKQYIFEGLENFQEDVALSVNNQMSHW